MPDRPRARVEDVLIETLDDGIVLYDRSNDTAHWLDASAAAVWRGADGQRTSAEIGQQCGLSEAAVADVLMRLDGLGLLGKPDPGVSRRAALKRMGKIGGTAAILAPVISSVAVPVALATASVCNKLSCSSTGRPTCASATSNANAVCTGNAACRAASTCNCTCVGTSTFSCTGTCTF